MAHRTIPGRNTPSIKSGISPMQLSPFGQLINALLYTSKCKTYLVESEKNFTFNFLHTPEHPLSAYSLPINLFIFIYLSVGLQPEQSLSFLLDPDASVAGTPDTTIARPEQPLQGQFASQNYEVDAVVVYQYLYKYQRLYFETFNFAIQSA